MASKNSYASAVKSAVTSAKAANTTASTPASSASSSSSAASNGANLVAARAAVAAAQQSAQQTVSSAQKNTQTAAQKNTQTATPAASTTQKSAANSAALHNALLTPNISTEKTTLPGTAEPAQKTTLPLATSSSDAIAAARAAVAAAQEKASTAATTTPVASATPAASGGKNYESMSDAELRAQAAQNSADWFNADPAKQAELHQANVEINAILDQRSGGQSTYNEASGTWATTPAASGGAKDVFVNEPAASTPASGGAPASSAYKTTYRDSRGQTYDAWIIDGKTYKDPNGKEEVPVGSYVTDAQGNVWRKGYGNDNQLVNSSNPDYHYDYMEGVKSTTSQPFTDPVTGYSGFIVSNPVKGTYAIEDSNHHQIGYITTDGVYHSAYYDSDYDKAMSAAAKDILTSQGVQFNGDGIVKIANGQDQNMERTFLLNQYSDALDRGEDGAEILKQLGYTGEATPGIVRNRGGAVAQNENGEQGTITKAGSQTGARGTVQTGGDDYPRQSGTGTMGAGTMGAGTMGGNPGSASGLYAPDLVPIMDAWKSAAERAAETKADYTVEKGVNDLLRAQEDAEAQFKAQQEQISADEAYARDNQALYAEARGDKGGIGAAQYDNVANTAAINRQAVREQQTKLATDTWRQIADLRAQGEFEKADAVLEIAQTYLSNLLELEQWAANYNLSAAQFAESIREWEANFEKSVGEMMGTYQGQQTLAAKNADRNFALSEANITGTYNGQPTYAARTNEKNTLASAGTALLNAGIMPSSSQLDAMGMTAEEAQAYIIANQAAEVYSGGGGGGGGGGSTNASVSALQQKLNSMGANLDVDGVWGNLTAAAAQQYLGASSLEAALAKADVQQTYSINDLFQMAQQSGAGAGYITKDRLKSMGLSDYDASALQKQYSEWEKTNTNSSYYDPSTKPSSAAQSILSWLTSSSGGAGLSDEQKVHSIYAFAGLNGADYSFNDGRRYHAQISQNDRNWLLSQLGYV